MEVLAAVFTVRPDRSGTGVPAGAAVATRAGTGRRDAGRYRAVWCCTDEDVDASASRQLAEKVDLTRVAHLEQIGVFSDPDRVPDARVMATGFLGLVPLDADPRLPEDTAWHPVDDLPPTALDHGSDRRPGAPPAAGQALVHQHRLRAGAGRPSPSRELRRVYATALGPRRRSDQPAAHPDPARHARADRDDGGLRAERRTAGRDVPVHHWRTAGDRSVRGVPTPSGDLVEIRPAPRSGWPFQATRNVYDRRGQRRLGQHHQRWSRWSAAR